MKRKDFGFYEMSAVNQGSQCTAKNEQPVQSC